VCVLCEARCRKEKLHVTRNWQYKFNLKSQGKRHFGQVGFNQDMQLRNTRTERCVEVTGGRTVDQMKLLASTEVRE